MYVLHPRAAKSCATAGVNFFGTDDRVRYSVDRFHFPVF